MMLAQPTAPLVPPVCPVPTPPPSLLCSSTPSRHSPPAFSNLVLPAPREATVPIPGKGLPVCLPVCLFFCCLFSYTVLLLCCYVSQELTTLVTNQNVRPAQQGGHIPPLPMWSVPLKRTLMDRVWHPQGFACPSGSAGGLPGWLLLHWTTDRVLSVPGWIVSNPIPKSCASLYIAWE